MIWQCFVCPRAWVQRAKTKERRKVLETGLSSVRNQAPIVEWDLEFFEVGEMTAALGTKACSSAIDNTLAFHWLIVSWKMVALTRLS
jgi:hypothetical protein